MGDETRVTLLEYQFKELRAIVEEHMEKEEEDRKELKEELSRLRLEVSKRGAFVTGVATAVSVIWAVGLAIITQVFKVKIGG